MLVMELAFALFHLIRKEPLINFIMAQPGFWKIIRGSFAARLVEIPSFLTVHLTRALTLMSTQRFTLAA
jgi:hypothetical protein